MMDDPQKPKSNAPKPDPAAGLKALQQLVAKSQASVDQARQAGQLPPAPPSAPPIDTGSLGGLLKSFKDRLSYALFGSPAATPQPPAQGSGSGS